MTATNSEISSSAAHDGGGTVSGQADGVAGMPAASDRFIPSAIRGSGTNFTSGPETNVCILPHPSPDVRILVHGVIPPDVWEHRVWYNRFEHKRARSGHEMSGTVSNLVGLLMRFHEGTKDGTAIVSGVADGSIYNGDRATKFPTSSPWWPHATRSRFKPRPLTKMHLVCVDCDKDEDEKQIIAKVREWGVFAILVPSYSHLSNTSTDIRLDDLAKHAGHAAPFSDEEAWAFMTLVEGYPPSIRDGGEFVGSVPDAPSNVTRVRHRPVRKYRLVIPLLRPWHVPKGMTEKEAGEPWGAILRGVATRVGVYLDESTCDLQRLAFVPRRPAGRQVVAHLIGGRLLDWEEVEPVAKVATKRTSTARDKVRKKSGGESLTARDRGADGWVHDYTFFDPTIPKQLTPSYLRTFAITEWMKAFGLVPRGSGSFDTGGTSFQCPNHLAHSSPDTPDHTSFAVCDGDRIRPAQAMCFHAHCQGYGVHEFVDLVVRQHAERSAAEEALHHG